jgi:hypothetical protein
VRSYFVADWVSRFRVTEGTAASEAREWLSLTGAGRVRLSLKSWRMTRLPRHWRDHWEWSRQRRPPQDFGTDWFDLSSPLGQLGFGWFSNDDVSRGGEAIRQRAITFPLWLPAVVSTVLPAISLYRRVRRPVATGLCPACGYDLRATPGRCPECGTAIPVNRGAAAAADQDGGGGQSE